MNGRVQRASRPRRPFGAAVVIVVSATVVYACGGGADFQSDVPDASLDGGAMLDAIARDTGAHDAKQNDGSKRPDARPISDARQDSERSDAGGHDGGHDAVSASEGGMGCPANTPACSLAIPCTAAKFPQCETLVCMDGCCATMNEAAGKPCTDQGTVCDGKGACVECLSDSNCPTSTTSCVVPTCTSGHSCTVTIAQPNTECSDNGGHLCNSAGQCVECTATDKTACTGTTPFCGTTGQCVQCLVTSDCNNSLETCNAGKCVVL